ncbi:putative O-methyltransferase YrrM [Promicromonospora umidemergens]|uniref:Class I SAM-dependent methyltransferase n=1 Tax=Promicromonospora umidemergens TaxID=629679 RepID=A0ABP8XID7_9MICO|nr:class I SAM-dependent methyltransferase [Promicromonospora umidemergens]MCP2282779.1 putative O-methyltransferase YrrM [Promicromonospora umidemergens]
MNDSPLTRPDMLAVVQESAARVGFRMSCEDLTGTLLATLVASKPRGRFLEIGTGVGAGVAWMLSGMDAGASLTTIEINPLFHTAAAVTFVDDPRVEFVCADAGEWLREYDGDPFDLAFVDWRPGKFDQLDTLIDLLTPGGLYVVDDLLPQDTWPADHPERVDQFWAGWPRADMVATPMGWASGLLVAAKTSPARRIP